MFKEKVVLFGAGYFWKKCFYNSDRSFEIVAVIDNNAALKGQLFEKRIPIISLEGYMRDYKECDIVIAIKEFPQVEEQLKAFHISNYRIAADLYSAPDVHTDPDIKHGNWIKYLQGMYDKEGMEILEVGARVVTGACFRQYFSHANYTGFDYYAGENVDVVGDAHELSKYFHKKFDLIFSSAVFEHLAMPWKVSTEIIKLLKLNGHVFIETHYSYSTHERPWHFFQFSENALDILFPEKFGIHCIKKGCSNLIEGRFSEYASEYLVGQKVPGLYCHSEYLGQKILEADNLAWEEMSLADVVKSTEYPRPDKVRK